MPGPLVFTQAQGRLRASRVEDELLGWPEGSAKGTVTRAVPWACGAPALRARPPPSDAQVALSHRGMRESAGESIECGRTVCGCP